MSEEKKIEEQQAIGNGQSANDETSSSAEPIAEAEQPQTENHKLETENMEVHKHPHHITHKKKWTEYLLEFFMIFLAVFLGFLAENKREHMIEHKRAHVFAESLLEDLYADTVEIEKSTKTLRNVVHAADSAMIELDKPNSTRNDSILMYTGAELIQFYDFFDPTTGTYDQIKNSGALRYFKIEASRAMVGYETQRNIVIKNSVIMMSYRNDALVPFLHKVMNSRWIKSVAFPESYHYNGPVFKRQISTGEEDEWFSHLETIRRTYTYMIGKMNKLKRKALELITILKKEYHLE